MSELAKALIRPTMLTVGYSEKVLDPRTKILHSSGNFSKKNWLQRRVIQFCDFIRKDSPYHTVKKANQIADVVEKELTTKFDMQSVGRISFVESHLGVLESDFIKHSSKKSHEGIIAAFARANRALIPPTRIEDLMGEYLLTSEHAGMRKLYWDYSGKALSPAEVTKLRIELSKLALQVLVEKYGKEHVKQVVRNFERIQRGDELLDLKLKDAYSGNGVLFRLESAKENRERAIKFAKRTFSAE